MLRAEVESNASNNEKLKVLKEERLGRDLNARVFAERKGNEEIRERVKEGEEKR